MACVLKLCVLTASLFFTSRASGDDTFALSWHAEGGPRCITEDALRSAVERKLGRKPFAPLERADILIEGEEEDLGDDRFRARVTQRDRGGTLLGSRELEEQSCTSLLRAATLVVALFIDPDRPRDAERGAAVHAPPSSVPRHPRTPIPRAEAKRPERPAFALSLGAGGAVATGFLPSLSGSVNIAVRLEKRRSPWSFDWIGSYSFPQTVEKGAARGQFAAAGQQVRICLAFWRLPAGALDLCGGLLATAIIPRATGVEPASNAARAVFSPTAALAYSLRDRGAAVRVELGVTFPLRRIAFTYLNTDREIDRFYTTAAAGIFFALSGLHTIF